MINKRHNKETTWYIFRHGLATHSLQGYGEQILTARILPEAIGSIERIGSYLACVSESINRSSELIRCVETTQIITRITGKIFTTDKRLNEYYQESFTQFHKRVLNWFGEINRLKSSAVLVCTHGAVISAVKYILLEDDFSQSHLLDYPNCGELLIINGTNLRILNFNK